MGIITDKKGEETLEQKIAKKKQAMDSEPDKSKEKITEEEIQEMRSAHPDVSNKSISRGSDGETVWKDRNGNLLPKPVKGKVETLDQKKQQSRYETKGFTDYINSEGKNLPKDSEGGTDYINAKHDEASRKPYTAGELEARVKKAAAREATEKQAKTDSYNKKM
jgi:hypothetical protein